MFCSRTGKDPAPPRSPQPNTRRRLKRRGRARVASQGRLSRIKPGFGARRQIAQRTAPDTAIRLVGPAHEQRLQPMPMLLGSACWSMQLEWETLASSVCHLGFYHTQNFGQKMRKHPHFWLEPISDPTSAIAGALASIESLGSSCLQSRSRSRPTSIIMHQHFSTEPSCHSTV